MKLPGSHQTPYLSKQQTEAAEHFKSLLRILEASVQYTVFLVQAGYNAGVLIYYFWKEYSAINKKLL